MTLKVGRNDLCPCGSGQKFKKCCLEKEGAAMVRPQREDETTLEDLFVARGESSQIQSDEDLDTGGFAEIVMDGMAGDYGPPDFDAAFLSMADLDEIDAYTMGWNLMKQPEISRQAQGITSQFIRRHKKEEKKIKNAASPGELVQIMLSGPDVLNHLLLYDRLNETTATSIHLILSELSRPQKTTFVELATRYIYWSKYYPEEALLALVNHPNQTAYGLSLLCMLLGMLEIEDAAKPLWNYYHFFREKYPDKNYWRGPLLGLADLKYRRDHPIKISDSQTEAVVRMLPEFGVELGVPQVQRIGQLLLTQRIVQALQILIDEGKAPEERIDSILRKFAEILFEKK